MGKSGLSRRSGSVELALYTCEAGIDNSAEDRYTGRRQEHSVPATGQILNPTRDEYRGTGGDSRQRIGKTHQQAGLVGCNIQVIGGEPANRECSQRITERNHGDTEDERVSQGDGHHGRGDPYKRETLHDAPNYQSIVPFGNQSIE